ncbi:DUF6507 family protein [Kribbella sp. NPDC023855]|uniref:DUF6507 family protein n=1 Tax=Kribbella sp. NPDC023855 TaxID=3154698 RepID=UPI00340C5B85
MAADWNVKAAEVQRVLTLTQEATQPLDAISKDISDGLGWAMRYSHSNPIQTVLSEFADMITADMKAVGNQVFGSVNGAVEATKAYVAGQEEMAANAMRKSQDAWQVDPPKPPSEEPKRHAPGSTKAI